MKDDNELITNFKNLLDSFTYIEPNQYNEYIEKFNNREFSFIQHNNNGSFLCIYNSKFGQYNTCLNEVYLYLEKNFTNKVSKKVFVNKLHEFVFNQFVSNSLLTIDTIKNFYNYFKNLEEIQYKVISILHGFEIPNNLSHLEIGNFILCSFKYINEEFLINHPQYNYIYTFVAPSSSGLIDNFYIIHKNIIACDNTKAIEIFQDKIDILINYLLYCISFRSKDNSKISYTKDFSNKKIFTITPEIIQSSFSSNDLTNPLYIISPKIFEIKYNNILINNIKIIQNLESNNLCEIEQKINRAINWIGQSLRNDDLTQSFLFLAMGMECLLTYSEGFISPSITYQLAETCALLCSDDFEERKQIEVTVKKSYQKRSSIVHTGGANISTEDYYNFLSILKISIGKLLELIDKDNIKTSKDLCEYIKKCKYS